MKNYTRLISFLVVVAWVLSFSGYASAQMPKRDTFTLTTQFSISPEANKFGEHSMVTTDLLGVTMNDDGKPFLHNTSIYCRIAITDGAILGLCTNVDADGHEVYWRIERQGAAAGKGKGDGTFVFLGGTGKYEGIQGSGTYVVTYLRPAKAGTAQAIDVSKGEYTLP